MRARWRAARAFWLSYRVIGAGLKINRLVIDTKTDNCMCSVRLTKTEYRSSHINCDSNKFVTCFTQWYNTVFVLYDAYGHMLRYQYYRSQLCRFWLYDDLFPYSKTALPVQSYHSPVDQRLGRRYIYKIYITSLAMKVARDNLLVTTSQCKWLVVPQQYNSTTK